MTTKEWLASDAAIEKSKRPYAHFDYRTDIGQQRTYLSNPKSIAQHGFYPFIHYKQKQVKYSKEGGKKIKERDICYAAHIDRCIYQYYSFLLGESYNERVVQDGMAQVAVAYRSDLHKNNIDFAKRAIDFIRKSSPCYVMIGDFTGFFDNLDHKYLKHQWCSLLGNSYLPEDHYRVFKSITKYSIWELSDLLELNHLKDTRRDRKELNSRSRVLTKEEFKANRSHITQNPNEFGIPQGSPISGLLANVYMLDVDKRVNDLVTSLNGLYMRYSDDFIIVIPDIGPTTHQFLMDITTLFNVEGLTLEPQKTQYFRFENQDLVNCGVQFGIPKQKQKRFVSFLGFTFDGRTVSVRTKTIGKYYSRMYKKIKTIKKGKGYTPEGKHISAQNLYGLYSVRGAHGCLIKLKDGKTVKYSGNFLTYIQRSAKIFGKHESIDRDTRRHMSKIRKALN